ncbi:hypothetical protein AAC387_Pa03g3480 [Persea americana]
MPRPGPRPYECVRRAWHSERHQPIRGSLIKEIFRVVNEIHSSATKKNKEWQDKLPLVVLKAEEIMYSKASSEAEYMDLETLPDRASDAINTIIRRDEASESGDFLPPCIEAALNLGCIPRRASRSQRHNSPRCYLGMTVQEPSESSVALKMAENIVFNGGTHLLPPQSLNSIPKSITQFVPHSSTLLTAATGNATYLASGSGCPVLQDKPMYHSYSAFLAENFSPWQDKSALPRETHPSLTFGHVYPNYYRSNAMDGGFSFQYPQVSNRDAVIVGIPHAQTVVEAEKGFLQNLLGCGNPLDPSTEKSGTLNFEMTSGKPADVGCDLSLRLGPLSTSCLSRENSCIIEDLGSSTSNGSKFCDLSVSKMSTSQFGCLSSSTCIARGLPFLPSDTMDETLDPCSSK